MPKDVVKIISIDITKEAREYILKSTDTVIVDMTLRGG